MRDLRDLAEVMLGAAALGGAQIGVRPERLRIATKGSPRDVVTDLDLEVEASIREALGPTGIPMLGEELPGGADASVLDGGAAWVIDPIDGTANYISGLPFYGVSIGLMEDGRFVLGVVAVPALDQLYFTYGDGGAFLNGRRLRSPLPAELGAAPVAMTFSSKARDPESRAAEYRLFGAVNDASRGCLRLGSAAINLCYLATGGLGAVLGADAEIWDIAGALAIAAQAGCKVMTLRRPGTTRCHYLAGSPPTVATLARLGEELGVFPAAGWRVQEAASPERRQAERPRDDWSTGLARQSDSASATTEELTQMPITGEKP